MADLEYFIRVRLVPYAIGAVTFAQNLFDHIHQAISGTAPQAERPIVDYKNKICLITGGNSGIGRATAAALVQRGARCILACRSAEKADEAAQALEAMQPLPGCQRGSCEVQHLDLSSLASVKRFTEHIAAARLRVDLLFCNAGIMAPPDRGTTVDGLERQFQVNYLGHWRVVHDLVSQRYARAQMQVARQRHSQSQAGQLRPMRVIWLTSMTHIAGRLDMDDLQLAKRYSGFLGYANSKVAAILAAKEFQRRIARSSDAAACDPVTFCAVHPGFVDTQLANGWLTGNDVVPAALQRLIQPTVKRICPWILAAPDQAVQTLLYAASAPADQVKGQYIARGRVAQPSRHASDSGLAQRLWTVSCQLSGTVCAPCFS